MHRSGARNTAKLWSKARRTADASPPNPHGASGFWHACCIAAAAKQRTSSKHAMEARRSFREIRVCDSLRMTLEPVVVVENWRGELVAARGSRFGGGQAGMRGWGGTGYAGTARFGWFPGGSEMARAEGGMDAVTAQRGSHRAAGRHVSYMAAGGATRWYVCSACRARRGLGSGARQHLLWGLGVCAKRQ